MEHPTETLLIIDYGSQYTQLIARRARELGVFCLVIPYSTSIAKIRADYDLRGIILSGGPSSVYDNRSPGLKSEILKLNLPILGVCYGMQLLAKNFGGQVSPGLSREYGLATLKHGKSALFYSKHNNTQIWMSHGDHVSKIPKGFKVTAKSKEVICAIENPKKNIFGLQFHPEVSHSEYGTDILKRFLVGICGFKGDWTPNSFIKTQVEQIKQKVGNDHVICALSGGVDSSVAATLVNQAVGNQQTCVFVDTGLLRKGEFEEVLNAYRSIGLKVKSIRAKRRFLGKLKGVIDPERKRKIIGREFIKIFEEESLKISNVKWLVQGTLYPDVIESVSVSGPSATIKSHHNVGGLPKNMKLDLLEPLRELFKDEVRIVGGKLGLLDSITQRQPFPGPGLAIRILGEVTEQSLLLLQSADAIVTQELSKSGVRNNLWQYFAVLLPIRTVGVMGDNRTYERVIAVRAVSSVDGMTADWAKLPHDLLDKVSNRIINEVTGVNRVVYDVTTKPPGTIEWE